MKQAWASLAQWEQRPVTIMLGDFDTELWRGEVDEGGRAMKELLATRGVGNHIDVPPPRNSWTCRGPQNQRRCHDYTYASMEFTYEGSALDIIKRGDHRAVSMTTQGPQQCRIKLDGPKRDTMHSWKPTAAAAARFARRWSTWRPSTMEDVQSELRSAAEDEASHTDEDESRGAPHKRGLS